MDDIKFIAHDLIIYDISVLWNLQYHNIKTGLMNTSSWYHAENDFMVWFVLSSADCMAYEITPKNYEIIAKFHC